MSGQHGGIDVRKLDSVGLLVDSCRPPHPSEVGYGKGQCNPAVKRLLSVNPTIMEDAFGR